MKVFISWSGTRSKQTALLLHGWLPKIVNDINPWVSDADLSTGSDWSSEIATQLDGADFGIICVTPGNMERPWLLFEAGALSRAVGGSPSKVAPLLIGFNSKSDLTRPLGRFQSTEPTKSDMLKLLQALNAECALKLTETQLIESFDVWWPHFEEPFRAIESRESKSRPPRRPEREVIDEILDIVRSLQSHDEVRLSPTNEWERNVHHLFKQANDVPVWARQAVGQPTRDQRRKIENDIARFLGKFQVEVVDFDWYSSEDLQVLIDQEASLATPSALILAGAECAKRYPFVTLVQKHV